MKMNKLNFRPALLLVLAVALISYACTEIEDNSESSSLLTVSNVIGQPGDEGGEDGNPLFSDLCDNPSDEPQDPAFCTVFNDNAEVEFTNDYLQIGPGAVGGPTFMNDIIVSQYRVDYVRPNNRNTPGVDVPFGIDGTMSFRVPIGNIGATTLTVVRHIAKREPPLNQVPFEGEGVLTANAQMRFFGHDVAGRAVSTVGFLEIHFANFGED